MFRRQWTICVRRPSIGPGPMSASSARPLPSMEPLTALVHGGLPCAVTPTYTDIEHSGIGYAYGILGGWNYQMDSFVMGIEGDWAFGGTVATNDEADHRHRPELQQHRNTSRPRRLGPRQHLALFYRWLGRSRYGIRRCHVNHGKATASGSMAGQSAAVLSTPSPRTSAAGSSISTSACLTPTSA